MATAVRHLLRDAVFAEPPRGVTSTMTGRSPRSTPADLADEVGGARRSRVGRVHRARREHQPVTRAEAERPPRGGEPDLAFDEPDRFVVIVRVGAVVRARTVRPREDGEAVTLEAYAERRRRGRRGALPRNQLELQGPTSTTYG